MQVDSEDEVTEWVTAFREIIKTVRGSHQASLTCINSEMINKANKLSVFLFR